MVVQRNALTRTRTKTSSTRARTSSTRAAANRSSQYGLPPPSPTAGTWAGALGWNVGTSGTTVATFWNTNMRSGDFANVTLSAASRAVPSIAQGSVYASLQLANNSDAVTTANLQELDLIYFNRYGGGVQNWVIYGDDQATFSTATAHIISMQSHVDTIRNFSRGTWLTGSPGWTAPAFKVLYIPAGAFVDANIAAYPQMASYPDGILFQSQTWEDQSDGANQAYVTRVATDIALLKAAASPGNTVAVQVQTYSKSNPTTVWTPTKMIADIDAIGAACNPAYINIWFADNKASASSTTCFTNTLAHYRP